MNISENIKKINNKIEKAKERSIHTSDYIRIIAVTKKFGPEVIEEALSHGLNSIGENRVQEAEEKYRLIGERAEWHLIGHLQKNKAKKAVVFSSLIHSVDSFELAAEIDTRAAKIDKIQEILIQVNTSGEESKSGIEPSSLTDLLSKLNDLKNISTTGLMTMAPYTKDEKIIRACFRALRELMETVNKKNITRRPLEHLSMGMSNDFEIAVEEGATFLRLGTVLFGQRPY